LGRVSRFFHDSPKNRFFSALRCGFVSIIAPLFNLSACSPDSGGRWWRCFFQGCKVNFQVIFPFSSPCFQLSFPKPLPAALGSMQKAFLPHVVSCESWFFPALGPRPPPFELVTGPLWTFQTRFRHQAPDPPLPASFSTRFLICYVFALPKRIGPPLKIRPFPPAFCFRLVPCTHLSLLHVLGDDGRFLF